jgi:hypothetical protein
MMFTRASLAGLVLVVGLAAPAHAQVTLEWKFKQGDQFFVEEKTVTDTLVKAMGMEIMEKTTVTRISRFTVKDRSPEGVELEQQIDSWTTKKEGGLGGDDDKLAELSKGMKFTVKLGRTGKITSFKGYNDFMEKFKTLGDLEAKMLKSIVTEEALKAPLVMVFTVLPQKAVSKGQTWREEIVIPAGPIGTIRLSNEYTYEGKDNGNDKIGVKGAFSYTLPKADGDLPFKVIKGNLTSREGGKGSMLFNSTDGRLVSINTETKYTGNLTLDIGGVQLPMDLTATELRTIRVLDKNPAGG